MKIDDERGKKEESECRVEAEKEERESEGEEGKATSRFMPSAFLNFF
jgi:hypothetical protein